VLHMSPITITLALLALAIALATLYVAVDERV
jgi:hypothetical protein